MALDRLDLSRARARRLPRRAGAVPHGSAALYREMEGTSGREMMTHPELGALLEALVQATGGRRCWRSARSWAPRPRGWPAGWRPAGASTPWRPTRPTPTGPRTGLARARPARPHPACTAGRPSRPSPACPDGVYDLCYIDADKTGYAGLPGAGGAAGAPGRADRGRQRPLRRPRGRPAGRARRQRAALAAFTMAAVAHPRLATDRPHRRRRRHAQRRALSLRLRPLPAPEVGLKDEPADHEDDEDERRHLQRPHRQRHHLADEQQQRRDHQQDPDPSPAGLVVRQLATRARVAEADVTAVTGFRGTLPYTPADARPAPDRDARRRRRGRGGRAGGGARRGAAHRRRSATCRASPPTDAAGIDAMLARAGSPMAGEGATFVTEAAAAGIDPRAIVAIAAHETMLETYGPAQEIHNPFGLGPGIAFPSEREAIVAGRPHARRLVPPRGPDHPRHHRGQVGAGRRDQRPRPGSTPTGPPAPAPTTRRSGGDPSRTVLLADQSAAPGCAAAPSGSPDLPTPAPSGPPVVTAWGGARPAVSGRTAADGADPATGRVADDRRLRVPGRAAGGRARDVPRPVRRARPRHVGRPGRR